MSSRPEWFGPETDCETDILQRMVLDAVPTPLLSISDNSASALNRAARRVFGTDDRILPLQSALVDKETQYFQHEGCHWRVDRVETPNGPTIAALINVEREELAAQTRVSSELISVLGHELLNGLAPIVSLAESAAQAAEKRPVNTELLEEILGPLARRAEGLQRFAIAYRSLARLPPPHFAPVSVEEFAHDCAMAFEESWPDITLSLKVAEMQNWSMDRDQMYQAVWALLKNASEAVLHVPKPMVELAISRDGKRLAIAVTDNGHGIEPEHAVQIFRPFHTTKSDGSGVGLSLARQIAGTHGGVLKLGGANPTKFVLSLPYQSDLQV